VRSRTLSVFRQTTAIWSSFNTTLQVSMMSRTEPSEQYSSMTVSVPCEGELVSCRPTAVPMPLWFAASRTPNIVAAHVDAVVRDGVRVAQLAHELDLALDVGIVAATLDNLDRDLEAGLLVHGAVHDAECSVFVCRTPPTRTHELLPATGQLEVQLDGNVAYPSPSFSSNEKTSSAFPDHVKSSPT